MPGAVRGILRRHIPAPLRLPPFLPRPDGVRMGEVTGPLSSKVTKDVTWRQCPPFDCWRVGWARLPWPGLRRELRHGADG